MKFRVAAVSDGKEMYQEEYARAELLVFRRSGCLNSLLWLPRFHVIATSGPNKCGLASSRAILCLQREWLRLPDSIYARVNRWKNKGWEPELRLLLPRFDFNARLVAHVITHMSSQIALMQIEKYKWPLLPCATFLNQLALSKLERVQIIQLLTSSSYTSMIVYKLSSIDATQDSGAAD